LIEVNARSRGPLVSVRAGTFTGRFGADGHLMRLRSRGHLGGRPGTAQSPYGARAGRAIPAGDRYRAL